MVPFAPLAPFLAPALLLAPQAPSQLAVDNVEQRVTALEKLLEPQKKPESLQASFKDGLRLESADKAFQLKLGGRLQFDTFFGRGDDDLESTTGKTLEDGSQMRRARLALSGIVYEAVDFKLEFDWADKDGKSKIVDVYAGLIGPGLIPSVRAGHFREPFFLEMLSSSNDVSFQERSLPLALVPQRNLGLQLFDTLLAERVTWAAGVFRDANDQAYGQEDGRYAVTARVTGLPWLGDESHLLHLGVAASRRSPPADTVAYKSKPEANLAPDLVDTGNITNADQVDLLGAEAALLFGQFSLQGEWVEARVDSATAGDPSFSGWYGGATWTITGEPRRYRKSDATFQSPRPSGNFGQGGYGAWELAARLSELDLEDGNVAGGQLRDVTLGLNWYLNPVTRVTWNYIRSQLDRAPDDGDAEIFEMRIQFAF
jgi:phosphate-selective porin OprO/OprP